MLHITWKEKKGLNKLKLTNSEISDKIPRINFKNITKSV